MIGQASAVVGCDKAGLLSHRKPPAFSIFSPVNLRQASIDHYILPHRHQESLKMSYSFSSQRAKCLCLARQPLGLGTITERLQLAKLHTVTETDMEPTIQKLMLS